MISSHIYINKRELNNLNRAMNKNSNGICTETFILRIRGKMNDRRRNMVERVYSELLNRINVSSMAHNLCITAIGCNSAEIRPKLTGFDF